LERTEVELKIGSLGRKGNARLAKLELDQVGIAAPVFQDQNAQNLFHTGCLKRHDCNPVIVGWIVGSDRRKARWFD
jgi:hypothetical protein